MASFRFTAHISSANLSFSGTVLSESNPLVGESSGVDDLAGVNCYEALAGHRTHIRNGAGGQRAQSALYWNRTRRLTTILDFGNLCKDQGKMVEAEEMYARGLPGLETVFAPSHTLTLMIINSLESPFSALKLAKRIRKLIWADTGRL